MIGKPEPEKIMIKQRDESMMRFKLFASCNNAPIDRLGRQSLFLRPKITERVLFRHALGPQRLRSSSSLCLVPRGIFLLKL
jgi:hypothetical protein